MMRRIFILLVFSLALCLPRKVSAQEADPKVESIMQPKNKKQKKADKKKEKEKAKAQKAVDKAKKQHLKNQSKEVRKRMMRNKKESRRLNHNERRSFFQRMFSKRR